MNSISTKTYIYLSSFTIWRFFKRSMQVKPPFLNWALFNGQFKKQLTAYIAIRWFRCCSGVIFFKFHCLRIWNIIINHFFQFRKTLGFMKINLVFKLSKEWLHWSVVQAVSTSGLWLSYSHSFYTMLIIWMCVMEALIWMDHSLGENFPSIF